MKAHDGLRRTLASQWPRARMPSPRTAPWAFIALLPSRPAFASKEGAAAAEAVGVIIVVVPAVFVACVVGGILYGAIKTGREGGSLPTGIARGLLKAPTPADEQGAAAQTVAHRRWHHPPGPLAAFASTTCGFAVGKPRSANGTNRVGFSRLRPK